MKWITQRWHELCSRYRTGFLTSIFCVLVVVLATFITWLATKDLYDQQAAKRWAGTEGDYAQISCFYPVSTELSEFGFLSLHHAVEEALVAASVTAEEPDADLFADAYSVTGKISVSTGNVTKQVHAVGVSDSFFLFHPVHLLSGSYFDENMIMKDGIILDKETAFALYGSEDVVGMPVYIGDTQYYIRGVVQKDAGYIAKKAGLSEAVCYVPVETLRQQGTIVGSYTYEAVIPSPVEGFAYKTVVAALDDSQQIEVVENSSRFSLGAQKEILLDFGVRSMSRNAVVYPYWENIARAAEDLCAVVFVCGSIAFVTAAVLLIRYSYIVYKNRSRSITDVFAKMCKNIYDRISKRGKLL